MGSIRKQLNATVTAAMDNFPISEVYVTGHSLGASMALLATFDLEAAGLPVERLYTYGEPRIGNQALADYASSKFQGRHYRVVHHKDPVPHLAPEALGYRHPSIEVYYPKSDTGNYTVCDGSGEDIHCSDQHSVNLDIVDHWNYVGESFADQIVACDA